MNSSFLSDLNEAQAQAVTSSGKNLLVLAGAGSGKTRVLVYRIAWLLSQGTDLRNILAVTFTNKAAKEMRDRLESMLGISLAPMWIGTFHGLAHRLLRLHHIEAGLDESFQILDADDQARLLKRIYKTLSFDQDQWPIKQAQAFINSCKEKGVRAGNAGANDYREENLVKIYKAYEEVCNRSSLVDFAELLLRSHELWQNNQEIRKQYQERFKHILVDEFQDTNSIQYSWIKMISGKESSLTAVGDDDQSIYSWRGADSGNMMRLSKDYPSVDVVRLERNYRSTSTILNAANAVITNNNGRLGKNLWTKDDKGEPIVLYTAFNETDEARYMVGEIKSWVNQGKSLDDVAILYRSNAQSRVIEEQLLHAGINYKVYGGMRFFERAEIKDVLAYLRLLVNPNDDAAFERVVNLPARGVGEAALATLRNIARSKNTSLWYAAIEAVATKQLPARSLNSLERFINIIKEGEKETHEMGLAELIEFIIDFVGLRAHYSKSQHDERKHTRLENLDELITASDQFSDLVAIDDKRELLQSFLSHVALEAGEHVGDSEDVSSVKLMTLHAAKGLEFPLVFLCGLEEGLFPHIMSIKTREDVEEERRLCYVGMTRAMKKLYLLHAGSRRLRGSSQSCRPSRFLREIPEGLVRNDSLLQTAKPASFNFSNKSSVDFSDNFSQELESVDNIHGFRLGQNVFHKSFGEGVITGFEGEGDFMLVKINFKKVGSKLLSPKYAKIEVGV